MILGGGQFSLHPGYNITGVGSGFPVSLLSEGVIFRGPAGESQGSIDPGGPPDVVGSTNAQPGPSTPGGAPRAIAKMVRDVGASINQGSAITGNVTANTLGAWSTIWDNVPSELMGLIIQANQCNDDHENHMMEFGIGSAGGEVVKIYGLRVETINEDSPHMVGSSNFMLPLNIPKGATIRGRLQSAGSASSQYVYVAMEGIPKVKGFTGYNNFQSIGHSYATSRGTWVSGPGSADTWSSWIEMGRAEFNVYAMGWCGGKQGDGTLSAAINTFEIGFGEVGNEQICAPVFTTRTTTTDDTIHPVNAPTWPCYIPAGSRIVARAWSDVTAGDSDGTSLSIWMCGDKS